MAVSRSGAGLDREAAQPMSEDRPRSASVPKCWISRNSAIRKPKSPTRLVMNAFLPALAAESLQKEKADQQVGRQAHALPADEHEQVVVRQHQREHEEHEQVEVAEEAVVSALVLHVSHGIDVDEEADAGDDQHHDHREMVEIDAVVDGEIPGAHPGAVGCFERIGAGVHAACRRVPQATSERRRGRRRARRRRPRTWRTACQRVR